VIVSGKTVAGDGLSTRAGRYVPCPPGGGGGGGVDGPVCGIGVFIAGLWDSARVGYVGVRRDRGCLG
jgi:hypothetical protein